MKSLLSLFIAVGLTMGVAAAQDSGNAGNSVGSDRPGSDVNGFKSPSTLNQNSKQITRFPNPHPDLHVRVGGIFVDGAQYGGELINPYASPGYGYGEKYLSAPSSRADLMHESGPAAHRDAGGFKLFSIEF